MRVLNVIITTAGSGEAAVDGTVDRVIRHVLALKKNPILVTGPEGDDVLGATQMIESCDLIFDPNYQGGVFSGIKAGLHASGPGPVFALPLQLAVFATVPWMEAHPWQILENELTNPLALKTDAISLMTHMAEHHARAVSMIFPQLITPQGVKRLLTLDSQTDWQTAIQVSWETQMTLGDQVTPQGRKAI